jgi:transcriptional regulator with XRE-family HTH domain
MSDNETEATSSQDKRDLMEQIGRTLTERRKLRKLSISDISQSLKIRASFIEALESGQWKELPAEVFARGFCIRYAQYLGLNGRELLASYIDKTSTDARTPNEFAPQFKKTDPVKSPWVWAGVGLLFVAGMVKFLKPNAPPAAPAVSKPMPGMPKEEKPAAPAEAPKVVLEKHKIDVYTPEQLWLRVKSSDRTFEGFIPEGATWTFSGEGQFDIRMGHSHNIALMFDGQNVALKDDQKKVLLP